MSNFDNRDANMLLQVKAKLELKSDAELARLLGLDRKALSDVMRGRRRLGIKGKIKVLDRTLYIRSREFLEALLPEHVGSAVKRFNLSAMHATVSNDAELLDYFKIKFSEFSTDAEVADYIGIKPNAVSMVRSGKSNLGSAARLRIFMKLCSDSDKNELQQLMDYVTSAEALYKGINEWRPVKRAV